jgi:homoserine kinase type II
MAVYTKVSSQELQEFLLRFDLGDVIKFAPIIEGIENSNYFLHMQKGRFVLTLFEARMREKDLPFFLALMEHLRKQGLPIAEIVKDNNDKTIHRLKDRPAILVSFLEGSPHDPPSPQDCHKIGQAMARMHLTASDFPHRRDNDLSLSGWHKLAQQCLPGANKCDPSLPQLISEELTHLSENWSRIETLPEGIIHADLFADNILFNGNEISGIIDFYFASTDFLAYDLAISLCANCFDQHHYLQGEKMQKMIEGYNYARPLSGEELAAIPLLMRGACLRFLLTRLYDWLHQKSGALVTVKNPIDYAKKILHLKEYYS